MDLRLFWLNIPQTHFFFFHILFFQTNIQTYTKGCFISKKGDNFVKLALIRLVSESHWSCNYFLVLKSILMMYTVLVLFCHGLHPVKNNLLCHSGRLVGFALKRIACALNTHWKEFELLRCPLLSHVVVDVQMLLDSGFTHLPSGCPLSWFIVLWQTL